mgnify:FL=1
MNNTRPHPHHSKLVSVLWNIADGLRGTYRPPQYRRVMLPLVVLSRFDAILSRHTDAMKARFDEEQAKPEGKRLPPRLLDKVLTQIIGSSRKEVLYNVSGFNLTRLLDDADHIAANLSLYIQGFSPKARDIFDKFEFDNEINKLDESNRLFQILKNFVGDLKKEGLALSPEAISNTQMGYLFEELIRKFNEQANEEAGDHFTPREVIELMVNIVFNEDHQELKKEAVYRTIYDPTCGTGGMLSESEKHLKSYNNAIKLGLYGQEYNNESYAICCADLLIKDEPAANIIFGDTLGVKNAKDKGNGFTPHDGHPHQRFDYMFANPPFGVKWENQKEFVENEHSNEGFKGRFGAGLPRINDGSLLFLQHMISKMKQPEENDGQGSRIAVVFNGSPLFTGDAGSGESNIRRFCIENDLLEAVIALPDQMFYNTGIYTYIWILSNKKSPERQGKIQLIDATAHYQKMAKSLGNKRNELANAHIDDLTQIYAGFKQNGSSTLITDKNGAPKVCSKIFDNQAFGYLKITVERPLRLNFHITPERIKRLHAQSAFINLAKSKKIKHAEQISADIKQGEAAQQAIICALNALGQQESQLFQNRKAFLKVLDPALKKLDFAITAPVKKAIIEALSERDAEADICRDNKGKPEPDSQLRDSELIPMPSETPLPLTLGYDNQTHLTDLLDEMRPTIHAYMQAEVLPHAADAWVDEDKTKIGYEIPINRHFYIYEPPRPLADIKADIVALEQEIMQMLGRLS